MARGKNNPVVDQLILSGEHTSKEIAELTGYNQNAVSFRARRLGATLPKPWYHVDHNFFKSRSKEMAYATGFIAADGCISFSPKSSGYRLSIQLHSQDIEVLQNIRTFLAAENPINVTSGPYVQLQVSSKPIFDDLVALGVTPRKSLTLRWINLGPELTPHLVRGYFDGDGCITLNRYNYPTVSFVGTKEFLSGIRDSAPVPDGHMRQHTEKNTWTLSYTCKRAMAFCDWMYQGSDQATRLTRKYARYLLKQDFQEAVG